MTEFTWTERAERAWLDAKSADLNLDAIPRQVAEAAFVPPLSPLSKAYLATHSVKKIAYFMPVSEEQLRWAEEDRRAQEEFDALPQAEQDRLCAEAAERRAIEKAERTCEHCGCDPDEHGGY